MKRPNIVQGIIVAAVLSVLALPWAFLLRTVFWPSTSAKLLLGVTTFAYLIYLLSRSATRVGRGVIGTTSVALLIGAFCSGASLSHFTLLCIALIWIVRSLYAYGSIVSALIDALLCVLSAGAALWALSISGSLPMAIWSFFLVQAVFVFIPKRIESAPPPDRSPSDQAEVKPDQFASLFQSAEGALRELAKQAR